MLRVTLDVNGETIGQMEIVNRGPPRWADDTDLFGPRRYDVRLFSDGVLHAEARLVHVRRDGAWHLTRKALHLLSLHGGLAGTGWSVDD